MHILSRRTAVIAALAGLAVAAPSASAELRTKTVTPTEPATWDGATANGANTSWLLNSLTKKGVCDTAGPTSYCDDTLVHVTAEELAEGSQLKVRIDGFSPELSDFDLRVYASDQAGEPYEYLGSPEGDHNGNLGDGTPAAGTVVHPFLTDPRHTWFGDYETKMVDLSGYVDEKGALTDAHFLVRIVYFTVANGSYEGSATVTAPAAAG